MGLFWKEKKKMGRIFLRGEKFDQREGGGPKKKLLGGGHEIEFLWGTGERPRKEGSEKIWEKKITPRESS